MALRNSVLAARRILAPQHAIPRRGGGGGPLKMGKPIDHPLPEEDELLWDDGTANPEPCLDVFPLITPGQATASLLAALSGFVILWQGIKFRDKPSKQIYAPREYPYDNLRVELGGDPEEGGILSTIKSKLPFTSS